MSTDSVLLPGPFMTVSGYFEGFMTEFRLPLGSQDLADEAIRLAIASLQKLKALGFSSAAPVEHMLGEGEGKALITSVMRRHRIDEKNGIVTPAIDLYQDVGRAGKDPSKPFGFSKWIVVYLNTNDDIAAFLKVSGFAQLEDIPLYDDDGKPRKSAYVRDYGKLHEKETHVPTPFYLVRKPNPRKLSDQQVKQLQSEGRNKEVEDNKFVPGHLFSHYEAADGTAIQNGHSDTFAPADSPAAVKLPEQNFHVVMCHVVQGNTGLAYKLITADQEVIWTNSNLPFTKAGYPVQPVISTFEFKPVAYIEAVQWDDGLWRLKPGEKSVIKQEPIGDVPF